MEEWGFLITIPLIYTQDFTVCGGNLSVGHEGNILQW